MGELVPFGKRLTPVPDRETEPFAREPLWRELVGHELRAERHRQGRTLADVAGTAQMSVQYLSEIERGRKEPSSEMLQAVNTALGIRLVDLTSRTTERLTVTARPTGPVALAA